MPAPKFGRIENLTVLSFPVVLTIGILMIPVVPDYSDHELAARLALASPRWIWGHLIAGFAFALSIPAIAMLTHSAMRSGASKHLRLVAVPASLGAVLHAMGLALDGAGPRIVADSGAPAGTFFGASADLVPPLFVAGAVLFAAAQVSLAIAARKSGLVPQPAGFLALTAAIVFSVAEAIPSGWALYGVAAASWLIYLPLLARRTPIPT